MPNIKELLKKKEKIAADSSNVNIAQEKQQATLEQPASLAVPEFKIVRTTTESEEVVQAPEYPEDYAPPASESPKKSRKSGESKRHTLGFRRISQSTPSQGQDEKSLPIRPKGERRLSARLGLHRTPSSESTTSQHLPGDLPEAPDAIGTRQANGAGGEEAYDHREAQWEKRATLLAEKNPLLEGGGPAPSQDQTRSRSKSRSPSISDRRGDDDIQEAIRLHEIGELGLSTAMFGRLGDPKGANNALAQVLYGLALRHGWGVDVDSATAIQYLSLAASNSAGIEKAALESGLKKGGAAKGELVLAIFELGNCFRHGWGVKKDAPAARQYYETAANLGDTDAMEEAAWCYLEGFGGAKDKVSGDFLSLDMFLLSLDVQLRFHVLLVERCGTLISSHEPQTLSSRAEHEERKHRTPPKRKRGPIHRAPTPHHPLALPSPQTKSLDTNKPLFAPPQFKAAQLLRLAEEKGHKTVGNSW